MKEFVCAKILIFFSKNLENVSILCENNDQSASACVGVIIKKIGCVRNDYQGAGVRAPHTKISRIQMCDDDQDRSRTEG